MTGEFVSLKVGGASDMTKTLEDLAPELRRGPARRALVKAMAPVLAKAIAETPQLKADIYRNGKMIRRAGTLKRALRIRSSKDVNKTGDVGVFVNIKPLNKGAISDFKLSTGRRGAENPNEVFFWRFVNFATKRNKNPRRFLQKAGDVLVSGALPILTDALKTFFERLNAKRPDR